MNTLKTFRMAGLLLLLSVPGALRAQGLPEMIGRIEGDTFSARGAVSVTRGVTFLASGSDVTLESGTARLVLVDGSEIDICGPAHLSLLKSGGTVTIALDYGRIHGRLAAALPVSVYTAQLLATPVSIAEKPRDVTIGLDRAGAMCVLATHGAVRLEPQLGGPGLMVPQNGEMTFSGGQVETVRDSPGECRCDVPVAKAEPPPARVKPPEVSIAASAAELKKAEKKEEPAKAAGEQVTFTAVMPPLTFDSSAPPKPAENSMHRQEMILLIREVRIVPAAIYTGRVEPKQKVSKATVQQTASSGSASTAQKVSFGTKFKNFFRRLFGEKAQT